MPKFAASRSPTRDRASRDRNHLLRRARAGPAGRRRGASRPSRSCSSRPSIWPNSAPFWRRGAGAIAGRAGIWAAHLAVVDGETVGETEIETDRARFLGRGQVSDADRRDATDGPFQTRVGAVLDPIFAMRRRVRIAPGATARIAFWTMVGLHARNVLDLSTSIVTRRFRARRHARLDAGAGAVAPSGHHAGEASLFQRLAGHVLYANPSLRPPSDTILRGAGAQSGLWAQGISGDLPIVLLRIDDIEHLDIVARIAAGARILADEAARRRSGDPQRTGVLLCSGSSDRARDAGARPASRHRACRGDDYARRRLRAARRPDLAGDARAASVGGAGRAGGAARQLCRSARPLRRRSVRRAAAARNVCRRADVLPPAASD